MLKKTPFLTLFEEAHKNAFEKERREIIARKRDKACSKPDTNKIRVWNVLPHDKLFCFCFEHVPKEREDFYRRLEEAQQKLIIAQNNLEKVLQKHQQEKKVTFKENSPAKVGSGDVDWL